MSCSDGTITCRLRREEPSFTSTNTCIFCFRADFTQPCKIRNTTQPYNERFLMPRLQTKNCLTNTVTFSCGGSRSSASFTKMRELSFLAENAPPTLKSLGGMFKSCEMKSLLCIFCSLLASFPDLVSVWESNSLKAAPTFCGSVERDG